VDRSPIATEAEGEGERGRRMEEVRTFFDAWSLFHKVILGDHSSHMGAYRALSTLLSGRPPLRFVDLGCGDACGTAWALAGKGVSSYVGIDISPVALGLARLNLDSLACPKEFLEEDFVLAASRPQPRADVVWIGLSLHHLKGDAKRAFLAAVRRLLVPGGVLGVYDPFRSEGETREDFHTRWWELCRSRWVALEPAEREALHEHVTTSDFPESAETLAEMSDEAGFESCRLLFSDREGIYRVYALQA